MGAPAIRGEIRHVRRWPRRVDVRRAIRAGAARGGAGGGIIGRAREVHDGAVGGGG